MKLKFLILSFVLVSMTSHSEIKQSLGVDQSVNYERLTEYGPWDDRNYQLTKEDLAILPENDEKVNGVPAFYKVLARKDNPSIDKFYPRSLRQTFLIHYGGLVVDGIWYKQGLGKYYHPSQVYGKKPEGEAPRKAINDFEVALTNGGTITNGNEVSVEMKPSDNMIGVAGLNGNGQSMFYTTDGGQTWTHSQDNPNSSCCDPTIDWASDSSRVYQADLGSCGFGGCAIRATYSDDDGVTWEPMFTIAPSGSDKEFIHVDRSLTSPFTDNVYITYHTGNVMQFARSTDMGVSWTTPMAFNSEPTGIGSDITTDTDGNIYYFYPALLGSGNSVRLLKSTDGGVSFAASTAAAPLNGTFDMPIPSMESREAFIYVSSDVDVNTNDIYIAFTDEAADSAGNGNGSASSNHAEIQVYKSTNAGVSWTQCAQPHDATDTIAGGSTVSDDGTVVDEFHPWLKVGENGVVHIAYYSTRHSTARTGVDFYYTSSTDGCASWETETRVSQVTSVNITNGQEWGDYNGLSVVLDRIMMTYTENKSDSPQVALAVSGDNPKGSPTFNLTADETVFEVCAGDTGLMTNINVNTVQSYDNAVTLAATNVPAFVSSGPVFGTNPITPTPGSSAMTFDVDNSGSTNTYTMTVTATGDEEMVRGVPTIERTLDFTINYSAGATSGTTLTSPTDTQTNVPASPTFTWSADPNALTYLLEVATDSGFTNVVLSEVVSGTSFTADSDLQTSTEHFWRVTSQSPCGDAVSSTSSFTTTVAPGDCPLGTNQVSIHEWDFEGPQPPSDILFGDSFDDPFDYPWTVRPSLGPANWSLQPLGDGGSVAWQAEDLDNTSDSSLVSPVMTLSSGNGPLTLRFWNTQTIEDNGGTSCWDAAQLLISVDGGDFTLVPGADIINDPYTGPITNSSNPASGEDGWCGDPMAATIFNVDVDAYQGADVQFAFRMTSDGSVGRADGWAIDNVKVTACESP